MDLESRRQEKGFAVTWGGQDSCSADFAALRPARLHACSARAPTSAAAPPWAPSEYLTRQHAAFCFPF